MNVRHEDYEAKLVNACLHLLILNPNVLSPNSMQFSDIKDNASCSLSVG